MKALRLAALMTLACLPFAAASAKSASQWVLRTTHVGTGRYVYKITADAVRIESVGNGGIAVCKAPTWKVSCFRPSEKVEYQADLQKFDHSSLLSLIPKKTRLLESKQDLKQSESIKGLNCDKYRLNDGTIYWCPAAVKTAPEVCEVLARYFSGPNIGAVPVRILLPEKTRKSKANSLPPKQPKNPAVPWMSFKWMEVSERLVTDLEGWKQEPYKASDFEYPRGYKRTSDIKEVIVSQSNRKEIVDLAKTFGLGGIDTQDVDEEEKLPAAGKGVSANNGQTRKK